MKKIMFKQIVLILCIMLISISFGTCLYKSYAGTGFDEADFDAFDKDDGEIEGLSEVKSTTRELSSTVITLVRIVSVAIAIVMLIIIGAKYMLSAPGDRADLKKHAVAYVVGAFILFGLSGILSILQTFAEQIGKKGD